MWIWKATRKQKGFLVKKMTTKKNNNAVKAVSFMMLITLVGKVLGLVREQLLAANYGNGIDL